MELVLKSKTRKKFFENSETIKLSLEGYIVVFNKRTKACILERRNRGVVNHVMNRYTIVVSNEIRQLALLNPTMPKALIEFVEAACKRGEDRIVARGENMKALKQIKEWLSSGLITVENIIESLEEDLI